MVTDGNYPPLHIGRSARLGNSFSECLAFSQPTLKATPKPVRAMSPNAAPSPAFRNLFVVLTRRGIGCLLPPVHRRIGANFLQNAKQSVIQASGRGLVTTSRCRRQHDLQSTTRIGFSPSLSRPQKHPPFATASPALCITSLLIIPSSHSETFLENRGKTSSPGYVSARESRGF